MKDSKAASKDAAKQTKDVMKRAKRQGDGGDYAFCGMLIGC